MSGAIDIPARKQQLKTYAGAWIHKYKSSCARDQNFHSAYFFPIFKLKLDFLFFHFFVRDEEKINWDSMRGRGEQMVPLHVLLANLSNLHDTFHASIIDVIRDCCRNCTWRSVFWSGRSNILPNIFVLIGQERWYFVFVAILVTILW